MAPASLLVLVLLWYQAAGSGVHISAHLDPDLDPDPDPDLDSPAVDLDLTRMIHRVNKRFLSVTIDASLAEDEAFMSLLGSRKVRTLAAALRPAFLRFGGTRQDFMEFRPQRIHQDSKTSSESCEDEVLPSWLEERLKKTWTQQSLILIREDLERDFRRVHFTERTVDLLHSFTSCSGLDLIFGLNALLRTADNAWNSSNAESLLGYCESRGYRMAWELGNEPNSFEKKAGVRVDGHQLGLDFRRLRVLLNRTRTQQDSGLYGPDVGQPRDHRANILDGFLQTGSDAVDACTWHHYYVNGRDTSLEDFLDPDILDSLASKTKEVLQKVKRVSPGKPVWLGETSSAYGGGAPGLSDTFAAGFMWLDKLGLAARLGLDVVMRQVLIGSGSYHLVDENLDPLPDFWLSLVYKAVVGLEVLEVQHSGPGSGPGPGPVPGPVPGLGSGPGSGPGPGPGLGPGLGPGPGPGRRVRLYLHCAARTRFRPGAVTLISLNLNRKSVHVSLPAAVSSSSVQAFVLESDPPGPRGLLSRSVRLNGEVMKMIDDQTLPHLEGARLPPAPRLQLPAFSLAFFVLTDAAAAACMTP